MYMYGSGRHRRGCDNVRIEFGLYQSCGNSEGVGRVSVLWWGVGLEQGLREWASNRVWMSGLALCLCEL